MFSNYHTHTRRCNHATGSDREYIENAIAAGIKVLGFSDHAPQFCKSGYVSGMRMRTSEAPEYVECIKKLAQEYKNEIEIYVGFEAEYFPDIFNRLLDFCKDYGVDYMIMGQHFLDSESDGVYVGVPHSDPKLLRRYTAQVTEGLQTGAFKYLAHPDVFCFTGDEEVYAQETEKLCRELKKMKIPLEINMLGLSGGRHYPSERFFKIAKSVGNDVIIGCDAHIPSELSNTDGQKKTFEFARGLGFDPLKKLVI